MVAQFGRAVGMQGIEQAFHINLLDNSLLLLVFSLLVLNLEVFELSVFTIGQIDSVNIRLTELRCTYLLALTDNHHDVCRLTFIVNQAVTFHISFCSRTERLFIHGTTCVALIDEFLVSFLCLLLDFSLSCNLCCLLHNILGWLVEVCHVNGFHLIIRVHFLVKPIVKCLRQVTGTIIEHL